MTNKNNGFPYSIGDLVQYTYSADSWELMKKYDGKVGVVKGIRNNWQIAIVEWLDGKLETIWVPLADCHIVSKGQ